MRPDVPKTKAERSRYKGKMVRWMSKESRYDPSLTVFTMEIDGYYWKGLLCSYVDDLDWLREHILMSTYFWGVMGGRFGITRDSPDEMLGMRRTVAPDGKSVKITLTTYIETMYNEFRLLCGEKIPPTPMPPHTYLSLADAPEMTPAEVKKRQMLYLRIVGQLLWVQRMMAPEISTAVQQLCRMTSRPTDEAIKLAARTVAYCYGKKDDGIVYRRVDKPGLLVNVDASNKGDLADGDKAQGGYVIFLGEGPIDWRSLRLPHVGLSAGMNEYMALAVCCQAVIYLQYVIEDMGFGGYVGQGNDDGNMGIDTSQVRFGPQPERRADDLDYVYFGGCPEAEDWLKGGSVVLVDNKAAITLANDTLITAKNRFYSRLAHYSKECVAQGRVDIRWVPSGRNYSDGCTKNIDFETFAEHFPFVRGYKAKPAPPPAEPR